MKGPRFVLLFLEDIIGRCVALHSEAPLGLALRRESTMSLATYARQHDCHIIERLPVLILYFSADR